MKHHDCDQAADADDALAEAKAALRSLAAPRETSLALRIAQVIAANLTSSQPKRSSQLSETARSLIAAAGIRLAQAAVQGFVARRRRLKASR